MMDSSLIIVSLLCFTAAIVLFFAELMVPSGGLLGLLAAGAMLGGIVMLFKVNTTLGLIGAIICVAAMPVLFMVGLKMWPHTPMAKWLSLNHPSDEAKQIDNAREARKALVGLRGEALTDLRPVGICLIQNQREECLADTGVIPQGTPIKVVSVTGTQIKVRPVDMP